MVEILVIGVGIGSGAGFPVSTVSVQNAVDQAHLGVATGVLTFLRSLGGALGVALLGAIALGYGLPLDEHRLQAMSPHLSAEPFVVIFLVAAVLMAGSLFVLALMPEKPLRGAEAVPVATE
jgi:MFS family permease